MMVPGIPAKELVLTLVEESIIDESLSQPSYVVGKQLEEPRLKITDKIL
jgi:hypothetical protein